MNKPSLFAVTTFAFAVFLVGVIICDLEFSARILLIVYAVALLLEWLARRLLRRSAPRNDMISAFILTAIFLLAITAILTLANQSEIAARIANWAYGFLVLGIAGATLGIGTLPTRIVISSRVAARNLWAVLARFLGAKSAPRNDSIFLQSPDLWFLLFILALFAAAYFITEGVYPAAERQFIVDVYPNEIADRATSDDLLISDNPNVRLSGISQLPPHLDVNPDVRGAALWDDLLVAAKNKSHVFWISVPNDSFDSQNYLATFLNTNGCLIDVHESTLPVRVYEMRSPLVRPTDAFAPIQADWGVIQLTGVQIIPRVCSGDSIAIALRWQTSAQPRDDLRVLLSLVDAKARRIQSQDFPISSASSSYSLVVPFGTPPGAYTLQAAIYSAVDGQRLHVQGIDHINLGQVIVERANDVNADPFNTRQDASLSPARVVLRDGVMLDAYGVNALDIIPGESIGVTARWRAMRESLPDYSMRVRLVRGEQIIAQASGKPVDGMYPTTQWRKDESVIDRWDVRVPPETTGGAARLEIGIDGGKMLYVADVNIATITRTTQIPSTMQSTGATFDSIGELMGYDVNRTTISANDSLDVTLYWRGMSSVEKEYRVFAQLIATDGHLIAQSDAVPASGQRPTRSWVSGEIIADRHSLRVTDKAYQGDATLIVGLYDPESLARVPMQGGGDFVSLPTRVRIAK